jgi:hypothetical protein
MIDLRNFSSSSSLVAIAEVLGAIGSIFTICHVVSDGLSRVTELYRAPAEVKAFQVRNRVNRNVIADALQEQVQRLRDVIQSVDARGSAVASASLNRAVARVEKFLAELHLLISAKLPRLSAGSLRARRRGWVENRRNIIWLCDNLRDARVDFLGALNVDIL